jgi:His-Xaa-Ser system radical SAM maturase HxsC
LIHGEHVSGPALNIVGRIAGNNGNDGQGSILLAESLMEGRNYSRYSAVLLLQKPDPVSVSFASAPFILIPSASLLKAGDIVAVRPSGLVCVLYRKDSLHNVLFVTERCNSRCLMCSQPPQQRDDFALLNEAQRVIELADTATQTLGISGGEPTLLGNDLVSLILSCRELLPHTAIHLLTNGRRLANQDFAGRIAAVDHPNLTVGIPLYSDIDSEHDWIVQAEGAFEETILGILNLASLKIPIELRIVIHGLNARHLPEISEFIYRNLPFLVHVAFMGMEPTGLALANMEDLWIDPADYWVPLETALNYLSLRGLNVSVFNHQLCTVPPAIRPFCRQSISDWKTEFLPICEECAGKSECTGFFDSAISDWHSRLVSPLRTDEIISKVDGG